MLNPFLFRVSLIYLYLSQLWKQAAMVEVSIPVLCITKSSMIILKHQRKARKERKKSQGTVFVILMPH
jgi:hypothetical protein